MCSSDIIDFYLNNSKTHRYTKIHSSHTYVGLVHTDLCRISNFLFLCYLISTTYNQKCHIGPLAFSPIKMIHFRRRHKKTEKRSPRLIGIKIYMHFLTLFVTSNRIVRTSTKVLLFPLQEGLHNFMRTVWWCHLYGTSYVWNFM